MAKMAGHLGNWVRAGLIGAALLAAGALVPAVQTAQAQPASRQDGFADIAERLMPAVVNIATSQKVEGLGEMPAFPRGSPLERFNDMLGDEGAEISSLGSGFIIDPSGVIVTNNHVIEEADEITVIFQDGEKLPATLIGRDPATDLAVLKVKAPQALPFVRWGVSGQARVGSWVIAIGNPFGLGGSVSAGIISARNRNIDAGRYDDFIQTDAAINRGNSGGPLFNLDGEVIGVNTAIVSPTGGSVGVGFATPSDLARNVVDQLQKFGETRRGWLGVRIGAVSPDMAGRNGLPRPRGALVQGVTDGSPAARSGLRPGDIVLVFDGKEIVESRNLTRLVAESPINKQVTVEFMRAGTRMSTLVTIAKLDEGRVAVAPNPKGDEPPVLSGQQGRVLGMTLAELTKELRKRHQVAEDVRGLVVTAIEPGTDAASKVQVGDVIVEMAFEAVDTVNQAREIAGRSEKAGAKPLLLYINRGGDMTFRSVRVRK